MGSPLDDLRNISKQINAKKAETEHNLKVAKQKERKDLSQKSLDKQQERQESAVVAAEKSKKIKIIILSVFITVLSVILLCIIRFVCFPKELPAPPVTLVSYNFTNLKQGEPDYKSIETFTEEITSAVKKGTPIKASKWYSGLSAEKRELYSRKLKEDVKLPGLKFIGAAYNKKSGIFKALYKSDDETSLIMKLVYDKNYKFHVVKIQ